MNTHVMKTLFRALTIVFLFTAITGCQDKDDTSSIENKVTDKQQNDADIVIKNVSTIDAVNGLQEDMTVVLRGNQIIRAEASAEIEWQGASKIIDGSGKYLIPGLWDAHIHLTFTPEVTDSMFRLLIANGITSVRDTGGLLDLVLEQKNLANTLHEQGLAPDVYIAGPLIDGEPGVYVGELSGFPEIAVVVNSPEEVIAEVDRLVASGVDLLKAYEMLTPETFKALIQRAKEHNLPVTGHIPLSMTAAEASAAGIKSMEHTRNVEMACSSEEDGLFEERKQMLIEGMDEPGSKLRGSIHGAQHHRAVKSYDPERCAAVIEEFTKNDTWQVPTHALMQAFRTPFIVEDSWVANFDYLPEPIRSDWKASNALYKESLSKPSEGREKTAEVMGWKNKIIAQMLDADIRFMAGTDAPLFYLTPGFSLHKELEFLVAAGMSPMQALDASTLAPAEYFGLEKTRGLVAPNMLADLVLLNANPLDDIRNTNTIEMVFKNGVAHDRAALDVLLKSPDDE